MAKATTNGLFICPRCNEAKPRDAYYANRANRNGIQAYCKPCWDTHPALLRSVEAQRSKKRGNPAAREGDRRRHREFRERDRAAYNAKNRAQYRKDIERNRERVRANAQRYRDANRDLVNERARAYFHANPEVNRARAHVRRARIAGVEAVPYSRTDVFERDDWTCQLCGDPIDPAEPIRSRTATIDHIVPIAKGGPDTFENAQAAHMGCNSRKRDRVA